VLPQTGAGAILIAGLLRSLATLPAIGSCGLQPSAPATDKGTGGIGESPFCASRKGGARRRRILSKKSSLFIRYDSGVGNARTCEVSFVDSGGIRHAIEVAAESLYEAAALAVKEFRRIRGPMAWNQAR